MEQHASAATPAGTVCEIRQQHQQKGQWTAAEKAFPTSIKEKETHWLKRSVSPLHHKGGTKGLAGIWRAAESIRLWNLAVGNGSAVAPAMLHIRWGSGCFSCRWGRGWLVSKNSNQK
eukprot:1139237-Pelagomonas_calceolata.AAC.1